MHGIDSPLSDFECVDKRHVRETYIDYRLGAVDSQGEQGAFYIACARWLDGEGR